MLVAEKREVNNWGLERDQFVGGGVNINLVTLWKPNLDLGDQIFDTGFLGSFLQK